MAILFCKHHLEWGADAMFLFNEMGGKVDAITMNCDTI